VREAAPSPETLLRGGASSEETIPASQGSNRAGFGSGMIYATCVIYLRLERASGRLVAGRAASTAALRGGACRRGAFGVLQGLRPSKTSTKRA